MVAPNTVDGKISNPFRPGAGQMPPKLAGRENEKNEFAKLLQQDVILKNLVLSGLRGVGKTVLLDKFKPQAIQAGWLWTMSDLSESASMTEESMAIRLLSDLSVITSQILSVQKTTPRVGFHETTEIYEEPLTYTILKEQYDSLPGLPSDKIKSILEQIWPLIQQRGIKGIVFAYDEAQNLADHTSKNQHPLSMLLDIFQSIQKKGICFLLVLTGLPPLFSKLVEARTFAERMFRVLSLHCLTEEESIEAILNPIQADHRLCNCFTEEHARLIFHTTKGYPYFIQYFCREIFDVWIQALNSSQTPRSIPNDEIIQKLDTDFFAGRWAKATDRQRDLLQIVAFLPNADEQFTVQEIASNRDNKIQVKPFTNSHISQLFNSLTDAGLVYKNRRGKYSFAVPLLWDFIRRQSV